jgi:hypothetical protein
MSENADKKQPLYIVGDRVEAKANGSTKFYRGKIIKINKKDDQDVTYNIIFDDGERKDDLRTNQIKKVKVDKRLNVLKEVMDFCRTRDFLKIFEHHIITHLKYFKDVEDDNTMRLEWVTIYENYLELFNNVLASKFSELGVDKDEFFKELLDAEECNRLNPEQRHFMKLMLASADMKDWIRIMIRESRYYYATGICHFGTVNPEHVKPDTKYVDPRFSRNKR